MSKRSREGKRIWRGHDRERGTEIADQITTEAGEQMRTWEADGRVPWWVRVKARWRGRRIRRRGDGAP